jgi:hypothetical protein
MDTVHKHSSLVHRVPSAESFEAYLGLVWERAANPVSISSLQFCPLLIACCRHKWEYSASGGELSVTFSSVVAALTDYRASVVGAAQSLLSIR